jgi:hypothetical protein
MRAVEFYYASFVKEHYLVVALRIVLVLSNIDTHPVIIDYRAKTVCYRKNCALRKFAGESVRWETVD